MAGGLTGLIVGDGSACTLAALPMPLGSLTEPFSPRAFAGPGAMPLTPASWAGDLPGVTRRHRAATLTREKIETSCVRFIFVILLVILGRRRLPGGPWNNLEGAAEVP
jgi:hypothetical protein